MGNHQHDHLHKITLGSLLVTLGIIYGDIGTSPLYVMKSIVGENAIDASVIIGSMSLVIWTLTFQTTIKYVVFTLRADNKGEGGIFSLYALIKKAKRKWLIFPAIIGGCCILGEGIITPPISVASAVEGLRMLPAFENIKTVPIVIAIITGLFFIQQFGTKFIGRFFGPIMLVYFLMLGVFGILGLSHDLTVLKALNPYYGIELLISHPGAFWLLGAVFLCTTGAEALYSDMGHCGRDNIRISWIFVKSMLVLNYMGQTAWLVAHDGETLNGRIPFYTIMPEWFLPAGVAIATIAAVVASQALISGSFTLINEAMRLNFWPKVKIKYPTELKGQMYISSINWLLYAGCVFVVLYFKESSRMEAAYGLTIILGMIMSSRLLAFFMRLKKYPKLFYKTFAIVYIVIEGTFPNAKIVFVSTRSNEKLLAHIPELSGTAFISDKNLWQVIRSSLQLLRKMWVLKPDLYIDLEFYSNYSSIMATLAKGTTRLGFYNPGKTLRKGIYNYLVPFNIHTPISKTYLQFARLVNCLEIVTQLKIEVSATDYWPSITKKTGLEQGKKILLVNPNASDLRVERRWPKESFVRAIEYVLTEHPGHQVVLVGNAAEQDYVNEITAAVGSRNLLINTAGQLNLDELIFLAAHSQLMLTNDTGPMHMAFALNTPTIALFGPCSPQQYGSIQNGITFYKQVACSPCVHKHITPPCRGNNICMKNIGVDEVTAALSRCLSA